MLRLLQFISPQSIVGLSVHNLGGKVQVQETLAFWDAYVEGDPAAKAYFASDALAHFSQGVARVDRR